MEAISRRTFLRQTGTGAAAAGMVSAVSGLPLRRRSRRTPAVHATGPSEQGRKHDGGLVVHVPDPNSGRVHVMFGTTEVVHDDPSLVAHLVRVAK